MKATRDLLSWLGFYVLVAAILGSIGVGDFRFYYGPDFSKSTICKGVTK